MICGRGKKEINRDGVNPESGNCVVDLVLVFACQTL